MKWAKRRRASGLDLLRARRETATATRARVQAERRLAETERSCPAIATAAEELRVILAGLLDSARQPRNA